MNQTNSNFASSAPASQTAIGPSGGGGGSSASFNQTLVAQALASFHEYGQSNNSNINMSNISPNMLSKLMRKNDPIMDENMDKIQMIADIGYLLSLLTLVFALLILTFIKRLRSPKNNLHLQLFLSFIIRCWFHWIRRLFVQDEITGFQMNLEGWPCKMVTIVWQYSLLANYNWILMEGVYLYSLIFFTSVSPYGPSILGYIVFGWTMPLVCIIPWIVARANYENFSCWLTNDNEAYFWILRAPITISILLNFIIYVRIVLVLYSKIFSGAMTLQTSRRDTENNYRKLLRSTLVLIPLFGVHYTALLIFQQWAELNKYALAEVIWLYIETLFSSCQGCIVACLYCFLNDEVHQEIRRLWRRIA